MDKVNHSIECAVGTCAFHAGSQNYCTLNSIRVGCTEAKPKTCECTECASFLSGGKDSSGR